VFKPEPDFKRLRKALLTEGEPDRVPLLELIVNQPVKEAFLGKPITGIKDDIEFWYRAGYDCVSLCPEYNFNPKGDVPKEGTREVIDRRNIYSTDENYQKWAAEGKGIITTIEDFERHYWPDIGGVDFSALEEANKYLPDGMKIIARAGDIFTHTWEFMGFETFSFALAENIELVERLFEQIGSTIYKIFCHEVEMDNIGAIWYSDDIAYTEGLMVGPEILRKYLFPWMKKIGNLAKDHNLPFIYHSDGKLWQVMDDLIECGVNALQPIEPKGMDAVELKESYGDRICLVGNIEVDRLARGTPEEIDGMVRERIRTLGVGGGYCVGSSNSVPEYVPLRNYVAMITAAYKYGKYFH
jgi:uroporphyrinogen decarboxylase